jgi:RHS repeat-associated protein
VKKTESGVTTYYLRSTILGGQVIAELNGSGGWNRGYVHTGSQLLVIQYMGVSWVHQEPYSKGQRITNSSGTVTATVELDPWGGDTSRSANQAFQPHRFTTYERDANGGDDAMMRRYHGAQRKFAQPDQYQGSYNFADPQSFNRYAYTQNDPVNFVDPSGLLLGAFGSGGEGYCWFISDIETHHLVEMHCMSIGGGPGGGDGDGGSGGGEDPQDAVTQIDEQKYNDCAKLLGGSPQPPKDAAEAILWTSSLEGTDATLLAVTWAAESSFNFRPGPNPRKDGGFDVGPLQTSTTYFGKDRFVNSLSDDAGEVMGSFATKGVSFNGNPYLALRWGLGL